VGGREREDRTARLISSCPSYDAGRVNELALRQGSVDPLSCRRWKRARWPDRGRALCLRGGEARQSEKNKGKEGREREGRRGDTHVHTCTCERG